MTLKLAEEKVLPLREASQWLPALHKQKRLHVATLYRWAQKGCRGVILETLQVGGTRCTSLEALQRFFDRLTPVVNESVSDKIKEVKRPTRTGASRVAAELDRLGI